MFRWRFEGQLAEGAEYRVGRYNPMMIFASQRDLRKTDDEDGRGEIRLMSCLLMKGFVIFFSYFETGKEPWCIKII